MVLVDVIASVLQASGKLKSGPAANEANTKALLIEPVLRALGWDLLDIDAVEREVKVYDGTFLDYALKTVDGARIYVEAKSLSGNLDDKKFVSQTVNYANNDGVVWCVLTNGLRYRVFKTNEVASMDRKLLFEVDLAEENQPLAPKAKLLSLIGHHAVIKGELDRYGERVFTDTRVRAALSALASSPSPTFLAEVTGLLGSPPVAEPTLRRSLARILDATQPTAAPVASPAVAVTASGSAATAPPTASAATQVAKGKYSLDHHVAGKAVAMRELWEAVDGHLQMLGPDLQRAFNKMTIDYYRGKKPVCSSQLRNSRVIVFLKLDSQSTVPWNDEVMRDITDIGHHGNGRFEYSLTGPKHLAELRPLLERAYAEAI